MYPWFGLQQSGLWHRNADGSDLEADRRPARPGLTTQKPSKTTHNESLTQMDQNWEDWFAEKRAFPPLRVVTYSALASDVIGVVQGILSEG